MNIIKTALVLASLSLTSLLTGCTADTVGSGTTNNGEAKTVENDPSGVAGNGSNAAGSGNDTTTAGGGTPCQGQGIKVLNAGCVAPKGTYVALESQTDKDAIANEMWTVMTNAQCWFKQNTTQNYVFYGYLQYTFWGQTSDSKSGGELGVVSIGRFEDKNAAIVMIRGEQWLLVTLNNQQLTLGKYINNAPYIELYEAHNEGRCI